GLAIHLAAQPVNMNVDDVRGWVDPHPPHMVQDHATRDHASGVSAKIFQQREFLRRELKYFVPATRFTTNQVQAEIARFELNRLVVRGKGPPQQVSQPGNEFRQRKWLRQVVITAAL